MQQSSFFQDVKTETDVARQQFSHDGVCDEAARLALEERYASLFEETDKFNRQLVSFQANKTEVLHSWIKYREGFSTGLVELFIEGLGLEPGDLLLDPFAGSCTTLLTAEMLGIDAVGIELLPHCHLAWQAKSRAFAYNVDELRSLRRLVEQTVPPETNDPFPHLTITETAFPPQNEKDLMAYTRWLETLTVEENPASVTILIMPEVSMTPQSRVDLQTNQQTVNHWFTVEEVLEDETKRQHLFNLLQI